MALISSFSIDDVYKQIKGQFRTIRQQSVAFNSAASSRAVSFTEIRHYMENLGGAIAFCDERIARYSTAALQDYARTQEEDPAYSPSTEYAAMKSAANTVLGTISAAMPSNSSHTVTDNVVVEPEFSTAQTATLRGQISALIATIAAP